MTAIGCILGFLLAQGLILPLGGLRPSVLVAPVLPGLSDSEESLRAVARACAEAGARNVVPIVLHLRPGVREHYLQWLAGEHPELLDEHLSRYDGRAYLLGSVPAPSMPASG